MGKYASEVVKLANSWIGLNESDGSYKKIIDIYNSYSPLPRGTKMLYEWAWCATTWSALAIKLGYTSIMPIEMSCANLITIAKQMGIWVENDAYVPSPGDAVLYDWQDTGVGDNVGAPDHVGTVVSVDNTKKVFAVVEGNYSNSVKTRTMAFNGRYIRGFITPKYDPEPVSTKTVNEIAKEVIDGKWGNGDERKKKLTDAGYDYDAVQKAVSNLLSPVTSVSGGQKRVDSSLSGKANRSDQSLSGMYLPTTSLNVRNGPDAATKSLVVIPKNTPCYNFGWYTEVNGVRWLYIQTAYAGVVYAGFCHSKYLKKK